MSRAGVRSGEEAKGTAETGTAAEMVMASPGGTRANTVSQKDYDQIAREAIKSKLKDELADELKAELVKATRAKLSAACGEMTDQQVAEFAEMLVKVKAGLPEGVDLLVMMKALAFTAGAYKKPGFWSSGKLKSALAAAASMIDFNGFTAVLAGAISAKKAEIVVQREEATRKQLESARAKGNQAEAESDRLSAEAEQLKAEKEAVQNKLDQTMLNLTALGRTFDASRVSAHGEQPDEINRKTHSALFKEKLGWPEVRVKILAAIFDYAVNEGLLIMGAEEEKQNILPASVRESYRQLYRGMVTEQAFLELAVPAFKADAQWADIAPILKAFEDAAKAVTEEQTKQVVLIDETVIAKKGVTRPLTAIHNLLGRSPSDLAMITPSVHGRSLLLGSATEKAAFRALHRLKQEKDRKGTRPVSPAGNRSALNGGGSSEQVGPNPRSGNEHAAQLN